ncbi:hypothetical protein [Algoriphagus sanaruensis]|nr:hypothetical protein [Algoriphagus sanaruensis]
MTIIIGQARVPSGEVPGELSEEHVPAFDQQELVVKGVELEHDEFKVKVR